MPSNVYRLMLDIDESFSPLPEQLDILAEFMTQKRDGGESKIPAGFTYLTQFIAHDVALDAFSKQLPWTIDADVFENKRSPLFDLETLYGHDEPPAGSVARADLRFDNGYLKIGCTAHDMIKQSYANDLPRFKDRPHACIVDERNDENLAVGQIQVAFIKFHNTIVSRLGIRNSGRAFEEARRRVIRHYQWIVLHDFLPRLVKPDVLRDVLENGNEFFRPDADGVFMPMEFAVGVFRMGHSMIRNAYNWNRKFSETADRMAKVDQLAKLTGAGKFGGREHLKSLPSDWIINWRWFFDIDNSQQTQNAWFNFAAPINTSIAFRLGRLNSNIINQYRREFSLPAFDLFRSRAMKVPSGQAIAGKIAATTRSRLKPRILTPDELKSLLPDELKTAFSVAAPVWFYFLAEAEIQTSGQTLGDVGSRIFAETILELLRRSEFSIMNIDFPRHPDFLGVDGRFGMAEMLKFIETNAGFCNPLGV